MSPAKSKNLSNSQSLTRQGSNGTGKTVVLKPRISEKAYDQNLKRQTYIFDVPADANKIMVAQAVAAQFDVGVFSVNIANIKGKVKQSYRHRTRVVGSRSDLKKAYVRLKTGDTIKLSAFEEPEESKSKESKAETKNAKEKK